MYRILYRFLASLARLTVRSGRSKDLEIIVLRHQLAVLRRQIDRPELTDADRSLLAAIAAAPAATEPNRVAGHPRHAVASAAAPHRRALDPTPATAGPTVDVSGASPTRTAPRSRESDLGISPHPRRTRRARPPPCCVHGLGRSSTTPESTPHPHAAKSLGRSSCRSQAAVACDFATIETVTLRRFYLLFFIDIATRTVYFAPITDHPTGVWTTQAARNLLLRYGHQLADARALVRDRASQFIDAFDEIFRTEGCKILTTPVRTPVANAFAERWIGTLRRELLDRTIIRNQRQLKRPCRRLHRSLQHAPAPPFTRPATTRRHRRGRPAR